MFMTFAAAPIRLGMKYLNKMFELDIEEHLDLYEVVVLDFLAICSSDSDSRLRFEHFSPTRLSSVLSSGPLHVLVLDTRVFSGAELRILEMALRVVKVADRGRLLVCLMEEKCNKYILNY